MEIHLQGLRELEELVGPTDNINVVIRPSFFIGEDGKVYYQMGDTPTKKYIVATFQIRDKKEIKRLFEENSGRRFFLYYNWDRDSVFWGDPSTGIMSLRGCYEVSES